MAEAGRTLPGHPTLSHGTVAAGATLSYTAEGEPAEIAEALMAEMATPHARMRAKKLPVPFSSLYGVLSELVFGMDGVAVMPYDTPPSTVALCTHNLFFCIGTALHYTAKHGIPVKVTASGGAAPAITLTCESPAMTETEAAALFGLLQEDKWPILQAIAKNSDFSITASGGDCASLCFHLPLYRAETYRVYALTAHTLRAAFMLPLLRFQNK